LVNEKELPVILVALELSHLFFIRRRKAMMVHGGENGEEHCRILWPHGLLQLIMVTILYLHQSTEVLG
jgi:hypothetical protein